MEFTDNLGLKTSDETHNFSLGQDHGNSEENETPNERNYSSCVYLQGPCDVSLEKNITEDRGKVDESNCDIRNIRSETFHKSEEGNIECSTSCCVVLQRYDFLSKEYLTEHFASDPTSLAVNSMSDINITDTESMLKNCSDNDVDLHESKKHSRLTGSEENIAGEGNSRLHLGISNNMDMDNGSLFSLSINDQNKEETPHSTVQYDGNLGSDVAETVRNSKKPDSKAYVKGYLNIIKKTALKKSKVKRKNKSRMKHSFTRQSAHVQGNSEIKSRIGKFKTKLKRHMKSEKRMKSKLDRRDGLKIKDNKILNEDVAANDVQEWYPKNGTLQCNIFDTSAGIVVGACIRERVGNTTKRKGKLNCSTSGSNVDSFEKCNKLKSDTNALSIESKISSSTRENSIKELMSNIISVIDFEESDEKFSFANRNRKNVSSIVHDHELNDISDTVCNSSKENLETESRSDKESELLKTFKSALPLETNRLNYVEKTQYNNELSDANSCSVRGIFSSQPNVESEYLIKPCQVVLTRCKLNEKSVQISSNIQINDECIDLSELSNLDNEIAIPKSLRKRKGSPTFEIQSDMEHSYHNFECSRISKDSKNKLFKRTKKVKKTNTGLSVFRSTKPVNIPPNISSARNIESSEQFQKRKSRSARDLSKGSGVNKEVLGLSINELTEELQELKKVMKRTERKIDLLIKLNEQVLDSYV